MHSTAPLDRLYKSALNVRKTDSNFDVEELADDIVTRGLLQNLDVVDEGMLDGALGVVAGGRRLAALQLIDKRGDWPDRLLDRNAIPILIGPLEEGRETSLAENLQRVVMNAADEFEGYRDIIADYETRGVGGDHQERVARCARRFGKTARYVEQRLRLAALAPDILEALRSGELSLDSAKAYATVADHALQMQVFAGQEAIRPQTHNRHSPHAIRSAFAGKVYKIGDRQVRYISIEEYLAAGGRIELDLFMATAEEEVLLDTELVDRLCSEKGQRESTELAERDGFDSGILAGWAAGTWSWPKTPAGYEKAWNGSGWGPGESPDHERATAIAIYRIAADGSGLELITDYFRPLAVAAGPGGRPTSMAPAAAPAKSESLLDRLARIRREKIFTRAVKLAAPTLVGTPLEGRAFYPPDEETSLAPVSQDPEGNYLIAILVRVSPDDVGQLMADAERLVDQEEDQLDRARSAVPAPEPVE